MLPSCLNQATAALSLFSVLCYISFCFLLSRLICISNLQGTCEFSVFALAGVESFSKLGDSIYFEEKGGTPALSIIQYIPSTFNWKTAGLTVTQQLEPLGSSDLNLRVSLSVSAKVILEKNYQQLRSLMGRSFPHLRCPSAHFAQRLTHW